MLVLDVILHLLLCDVLVAARSRDVATLTSCVCCAVNEIT